MIGFFFGAYSLHLRIRESDVVWKEECVALSVPPYDKGIEGGRVASGVVGNFRASRASVDGWDYASAKRVSRAPSQMGGAYPRQQMQGQQQVYGGGHPISVEAEERVASRTDLSHDDDSIDPSVKYDMRPRS